MMPNHTNIGFCTVLLLAGIVIFPFTSAHADIFSQNNVQETWGAAAASTPPSYQPYYEIESQKLGQPTSKTSSTTFADKQDWDVTLGLGMVLAPKYLGSKGYNVMPLPMISVIYKNTFFLNTDGIGVNAINWGGLKAGPLLGFNFGRRHTDSTSRLNGLDTIQPTLDAGGFVSYGVGPFTVGGNLLQAVNETKYGFTSRLYGSYRQVLVPSTLDFEAGPEIDLGNDDYMRTWFGVTGAESASSGLAQHTADGGVRDVGVNAALLYHYTEHILVRTFIDAKELTGDAADSPITESATQIIGGLGIAYHF